MKKNISTILIAGLTSITTILGFNYYSSPKQISKTQQKAIPVHKTSFNNSNLSENVDFRIAAKKTMPAVVHIKSSKKITQNRYNNQGIPPQYQGLFEQFFGVPHQHQSPQSNNKLEELTPSGSGSGVIIDPNGYIVTNNHVIDNADELEVILNDNRSYKATVIGSDPNTDIALIQIKEKNLPFLSFNNSDGVEVGEWVLAVGNPFNLNSTVTAGIVSAVGRNINILKEKSAIESFIQTDAAINPGNSGGALVNTQGNLLGINTAIASPTGSYSGYGFAVPSNIVQKITNDLKEYGVVQRGYLGIMIRDVDGALASKENLNLSEGVYVSDFSESSSAKKAGLKKGDVIVQIDGWTIRSAPKLQEVIGRKRPGDKVLVQVNREGELTDFEVTLLDSHGENTISKASDKSKILNQLGASFSETSKETNKALGIKGGIQVSEINSGKIRTHTKMGNGFVITKVNKQNVTNLKEFNASIESSDGGILIEGKYTDRPGTHYYALGL